MTILPTQSLAHNPLARCGMVTSPHYLASGTGLNILRQGGNALESAIATAFTLTVVYPHMCSLGGDAFWLIYTAHDTKLRAINASGRAGRNVSIERYKKLCLSRIPERGILSANTVPGLLSGLSLVKNLSDNLPSHSMSWKALLEDACHYASEGHPASTSFVQHSLRTMKRARQTSELSNEFSRCFLNDGRPYRIGERFRQEDLAKTLEILACEGPDSFYQGTVADKIIRALAPEGFLLTKEDFAEHKADWVTPLTLPYGDYLACNTPPNSQGMTSLAILNILSNFDCNALAPGVDYYHLMVEATKEAFQDRDRYLTDPDFVPVPVEELLSKEHGSVQAKRITKRSRPFSHLLAPKGDTVWFGVVDRFGNAVSCIQSIFFDFGSELVPKDTGILLQNRGTFFSLDPEHPNALAPNKRTLHTLNPAMLLKDGAPFLVYGTMGGEGQPQTQAALVTNILHRGMTPAEAVSAPRWLYGRSFGEEAHNYLTLEGRIAKDIQDGLRARGHQVRITSDFDDMMGHAGLILVDRTRNCLQGASDPRGDGLAAGF